MGVIMVGRNSTTTNEGNGIMAHTTTWTTEYATEWVCVDCHLQVAGYSAHELGDEERDYPFSGDPTVTDVTNGSDPTECDACEADGIVWDGSDAASVDAHTDHDHDSFSLWECNGCGSHLAGDRFAVTITVQTQNGE